MCNFSSEEPGQSIAERVHIVAQRLEPLIRRRFRHQLRAIQHVYDVDDLVVCVHLRIETALRNGRIDFDSPQNIEHFILEVARCAALDALRGEFSQQRRWHDATACDIRCAQSRLDDGDREELCAMLAELDEEDGLMLILHARGESSITIAQALGISIPALRSRWRRVRSRLRVKMRGGDCS